MSTVSLPTPSTATVSNVGPHDDLAPIVRVVRANKTYKTGEVEVHAVRDVNFEMYPGEFVAITGPSGSGKSTFMHLLGCLDRLDAGSYYFEEHRVEKMNRRQLAELRCRRIGFVFQSFNLLPRTSILYNVALPLAYQGVARRERIRRATEMLERVGLGNRIKHQSGQLSGGQQQRVAVARALVTKPALVLADEPTGNLDSKTSVDIMELFTELNAEAGITIALVTHEPDIAEYARREVNFGDGQIVKDIRRSAPVAPAPATDSEGSA